MTRKEGKMFIGRNITHPILENQAGDKEVIKG
jgi:hypothetical protein